MNTPADQAINQALARDRERNRPRWTTLALDCYDCGAIEFCLRCGKPVCRKCQCRHEGECWGVPADAQRTCCATEPKRPCTCPCHDDATACAATYHVGGVPAHCARVHGHMGSHDSTRETGEKKDG